MNNIKAEDIRLYSMNEDMSGKRTHQEYVDQMASMIINMMIGYRWDYETVRKLIDYAEQHQDRLNN